MTTNINNLLNNVNSNTEELDTEDLDELIDEPEYMIPIIDSINNPLKELEQVFNTSHDMNKKLVTFMSIYQSPYLNKNQQCITLLLELLGNNKYSLEERFLFLSKIKLVSDSIEVCLYGYVYWFYTYNKPILYKMLSAQFMMAHPIVEYPLITTHVKFAQQCLYNIAKSETEDVQIRSEAADILMRYATPNFRKAAENIINKLGYKYIEKRLRTIYNNSQNVHQFETKELLRELVKEVNPLLIKSDDILEWIHSIHDDKAFSSFQRILMDTSTYEEYTMVDIICYVYQKIQNSKDKCELHKRLIEELHDMNGWCSTGHVVRLLNVFQGYCSNQIQIPIEEEIKASVFARLSFAMKKCSIDLQEELLQCFQQEDKTLLEEFCNIYSPETELIEEYKHISSEKVQFYIQDSIKKYIGK